MTLNLKYNWVMTCSACPEQYDVFDKGGKQIAYVRARWNRIRAFCPDALDEEVFSEEFSLCDAAGCFNDDDHRAKYFYRIEEAIDNFYKEQNDV